ncbi:MAG: hypothetical protein ACD_80C00069G0004 [uncultured bacterium (gcode 4)]|uniref:Uncharacterized protein n=1 Tax=uncultured bacterium (gcode 4) TaxID=1234023 RepID=K1X5C9_9BACT|nr:MAG: hypothetical protein ACD_80C00069G0004 [uncultured bacterium (gcode 4)]
MMKNFLHGIIFTMFGLTTLFSTFAIVVEVPSSQGQQDVIVTGPTTVQGDESTLFDTIQTINKYLRFSIGAICMGVLIYWWINLMTAQWDAAKMKEANKLLMWALVGILIAVFSYALVRIIVNLL